MMPGFTASLWGEGATMVSEAVSGVTPPKYQHLGSGIAAKLKVKACAFSMIYEQFGKEAELLEMPPDIRSFYGHQAFLAGKIDVTAFMTWFVDSYPDSLARMREDPGYAGRFV